MTLFLLTVRVPIPGDDRARQVPRRPAKPEKPAFFSEGFSGCFKKSGARRTDSERIRVAA
jgi:hypothetical protein